MCSRCFDGRSFCKRVLTLMLVLRWFTERGEVSESTRTNQSALVSVDPMATSSQVRIWAKKSVERWLLRYRSCMVSVQNDEFSKSTETKYYSKLLFFFINITCKMLHTNKHTYLPHQFSVGERSPPPCTTLHHPAPPFFVCRWVRSVRACATLKVIVWISLLIL